MNKINLFKSKCGCDKNPNRNHGYAALTIVGNETHICIIRAGVGHVVVKKNDSLCLGLPDEISLKTAFPAVNIQSGGSVFGRLGGLCGNTPDSVHFHIQDHQTIEESEVRKLANEFFVTPYSVAVKMIFSAWNMKHTQ